MATAQLDPPDTHHLQAAIGWLELGNPSEAGEEIARISSAALDDPNVLEVRWQICAVTQSWAAAAPVAQRLVEVAPKRASGWIHRAYTFRRMPNGGLEKAWQALLPAAKLFPKEPLIRYNLACYATQFGRLDEGWEWFQKAVKTSRNVETIKAMAVADRDLEPLWERIEKL